MSVFSKHRQWMASTQEHKVNAENDTMCRGGHRWDGVIPTVNPDLHEIQNSNIFGKQCDCGHLLYVTEDTCGCPTDKYWKIFYE